MRPIREEFKPLISGLANRFKQIHRQGLSAVNLGRDAELHLSILCDHLAPQAVLSLTTMFFRLCVAVLAGLVVASSVSAQTTNVTMQPDLRLFTMMAALNAAGYDVEFASQYHPVRETVRNLAKEVDPDLIA